MTTITPQILLKAYAAGIFPMAESAEDDALYWIDPDKCKACLICMQKCPSQGIEGGKKQIHVIDQQKCDRCGVCIEVCPAKFDAVVKISGEPVPDPLPPGERTLVKGADK